MVDEVILFGRIGQDPKLSATENGNYVCNFSVVTSESWTDKQGQKQEKTEWHNVVVFGKHAEVCGQHLKKGRQVYVKGKISTREWNDKEGNKRKTTEIEAIDWSTNALGDLQ